MLRELIFSLGVAVVATASAQSSWRSGMFSLDEVKGLDVEYEFHVGRTEPQWPATDELKADLPLMTEHREFTVHLGEVQDKESHDVSAEIWLEMADWNPDGLTETFLGSSEVWSEAWQANIRHQDDDWQLNSLGPQRSQTLSRERPPSEVHAEIVLTRLLPASIRGGATAETEREIPLWNQLIERSSPNFDLTFHVRRSENSGQPLILHTVRKELNGGHVTLERYRTECQLDPVTGLILSEHTWFRITNVGMINDELVGQWDAVYHWVR